MSRCCRGKQPRSSSFSERNAENQPKSPNFRQRSHSRLNKISNRFLRSRALFNQSAKSDSPSRFELSDETSLESERKAPLVHAEMIFYCFEILGNHLFNLKNNSSTNSASRYCSTISAPTLPNEPYPLFVTWLIGSEQNLRGCIGTFTPINLAQGLREYAITSATKDSRFSPISPDEYSLLSCSVSILTNFEVCSSITDWQIGFHGIRIEFVNERGSQRSATYLPEVAREQGWNHLQTIDSLLRKAGYRAPITAQCRKNVRVTRYRSEKLTLHYKDYVQSKSIGSSNNRWPKFSSLSFSDKTENFSFEKINFLGNSTLHKASSSVRSRRAKFVFSDESTVE